MHYDVDEIEDRIYKIGSEFRCGGNRTVEAQDCAHEMCQVAFRYWKKVEGYLKNLKKCPSYNGTGQRTSH